MNALRIEAFVVGHLKQGQQNVATNFRLTGLPRNAKTVTTTGNFYIEAAFDLP
jgi:hypothetical protein